MSNGNTFLRTLLCMGVALAAAACDQIDVDGDGGGGAGGATIDGGSGGGSGGAGGTNGDPCGQLSVNACEARTDCALDDGACADASAASCDALDAAQCTDRDDCTSRMDVFGAFSECVSPDDLECSLLDEGQCGGRADCDWFGDRCDEPAAPECAEIEGQLECEESNACHWRDDACNDGPPPQRCDQPDPASCEAAGCDWNARGCVEPMPTCEDLAQVACGARDTCVWRGNGCIDDPRTAACDVLGAVDCTMRNDCGWLGDACVVIDGDECAALDERTCGARRDCEAVYRDICAQDGDEDVPPGGENPGDRAAPQDPPCLQFVACQEPAPLDCADVPVAACGPTPGCETYVVDECPPPFGCEQDRACPDVCGEPELGCRAEAGAECANLDERTCEATPGCAVEVVDLCDPRPEPGDQDGAFFPADPPEGGGGACANEVRCVPEAVQPARCDEIDDPNLCERTPGCAADWAARCADPEPMPDRDCAGEDCAGLVAPGCFVCIPDGPQGCWGAAPDACAANPACEQAEREICGCEDGAEPPVDANGDAAARPAPPEACFEDADCPNGSCWDGLCVANGGEACFCELELFCQPRQDGPRDCRDIEDPERCEDQEACGWQVCDCPPDAECDCQEDRCLPALPPRNDCEDLAPAQCEANPRCAVFDAPIDCPPCAPDMDVCLCPDVESEQICVPRPDLCAELDERACDENPACISRNFEACEAGDDGEPNCDNPDQGCPDLPGPINCIEVFQCIPTLEGCWDLPEELCLAEMGCAFQEVGQCFIDEAGAEICVGQDGDCGCAVDENGEEICWCEIPAVDGQCVPVGPEPEPMPAPAP